MTSPRLPPPAPAPLWRDSALHGRVWRLAGPMIVSNLSVPLLGAVDTALMGHLGLPLYIGAVAIGGLVFSFLYWGLNFLRMGTTGLAAQALGAGQADEVRATLVRALLLAGAIGLLLIALRAPVSRLAFALLEASPGVEEAARSYVAIRIFGAPAALANMAIIGWLIGAQNARGPLFIMLAVNGINIALDFAFVVGLGLRVPGVAGATLIADYAGLALGLFLVRRELARTGGALRRQRVLSTAPLKRMLSINRDIFIRTLCIVGAFAYFTQQGARQGDVVLAANAVLMNFVVFLSYGLDGLAHAAEALTGRALGARDARALSRATGASLLWCAVIALAATALYAGAGKGLVWLLTDLGAVRAAARRYLPWLVAMPLVAVWSFLLDGVFTGTTRARAMRNTMVLAFALFVPAAWGLPQLLGNHGLWLAFLLFMAVRGASLGAVYLRLEARGRMLEPERARPGGTGVRAPGPPLPG